MTQKDYELIAGVLRDTRPDDPQTMYARGWRACNTALASHFADALQPTNPRFDRERFIAAATGRTS